MLNNSQLRHQACLALQQIAFHGRSANDVVGEIIFENPADTSLFKSLVLGACRQFIRLEIATKQLLQKPFKAKDSDLNCLIILGLYQLEFSRIPDHAAISETVEVCQTLKKPWAKKLLNGVLRNYLRQREAINDQLDRNWDSKFAFPDWLIGKIKPHYKGKVEDILSSSNLEAPMTLRVNQQKISVEDYLQLLDQEGLYGQKHPLAESAIVLEQAVNVQFLPHFSQGFVSVQDAAAQLSAQILQPKNGETILDACAAPGGKSCHLREMCSDISLTCGDIDENRLQRVEQNLARLDFNESSVTLTCQDMSQTDFADQQFDKILLDAPCSATGVIRRHPDIKLLRRASDIDELVQLQQKILEHLWKKLKKGGQMLYATCSILPEENAQQMERFLSQNSDAELLPFPTPLQEKLANISNSAIGCQILPNQEQMDGFYYALLQKA